MAVPTTSFWTLDKFKVFQDIINILTASNSMVYETCLGMQGFDERKFIGKKYQVLKSVGHRFAGAGYPFEDSNVLDIGDTTTKNPEDNEQLCSVVPQSFIWRAVLDLLGKRLYDKVTTDGAASGAFENLVERITTGAGEQRCATLNSLLQGTGEKGVLGSLAMPSTQSITAEVTGGVPWEFQVNQVRDFPIGQEVIFITAAGALITTSSVDMPKGKVVGYTVSEGYGKIKVRFTGFVTGTGPWTMPVDAQVCMAKMIASGSVNQCWFHGLDLGIASGSFPRNEAGQDVCSLAQFKSKVWTPPAELTPELMLAIVGKLTNLSDRAGDPVSMDGKDLLGVTRVRQMLRVLINDNVYLAYTAKRNASLNQMVNPASAAAGLQMVSDMGFMVEAINGVALRPHNSVRADRIWGINAHKYTFLNTLPLRTESRGADGSPFERMSGTVGTEMLMSETFTVFPTDREAHTKVVGTIAAGVPSLGDIYSAVSST